jgi:hypothetical protein
MTAHTGPDKVDCSVVTLDRTLLIEIPLNSVLNSPSLYWRDRLYSGFRCHLYPHETHGRAGTGSFISSSIPNILDIVMPETSSV